MKGVRFDPGRAKAPPPAKPARPPEARASDSDLEAAADLLDGALVRGNDAAAADRTMQLRDLLSQAAPDASPRLTVRVWLALLDYMLHPEAEIRATTDRGRMENPEECGALVCPDHPWSADMVLVESIDYDNHSTLGWPDDDGTE